MLSTSHQQCVSMGDGTCVRPTQRDVPPLQSLNQAGCVCSTSVGTRVGEQRAEA